MGPWALNKPENHTVDAIRTIKSAERSDLVERETIRQRGGGRLAPNSSVHRTGGCEGSLIEHDAKRGTGTCSLFQGALLELEAEAKIHVEIRARREKPPGSCPKLEQLIASGAQLGKQA